MRIVEILDSSGASHRPATLDAPGDGSGFGFQDALLVEFRKNSVDLAR